METNKGLRFLCSLPVILLLLYFIPFLGVILYIVRLFVYRNNMKGSIFIIVLGVILLIPYGIELLSKVLNFDLKSIPFLYDLIYFDIYNGSIIPFSKRLITIGIIFVILSLIFREVAKGLGNKLMGYIRNQENMEREVKEKNDLVMQEKREKAKNTHYVRCPYCGGDNMLTSKTGKCKFCRRAIQS